MTPHSQSIRKERGFSLLEMLIVVLILGLIATVATFEVSKTLKKQRVEAAGQDFKALLDSVYLLARNGVFIDPADPAVVSKYPFPGSERNQVAIFAFVTDQDPDGERWVEIMPDVNNNLAPDDALLDEEANGHCREGMRITTDLSLSTADADGIEGNWPIANGQPTIMCDIQGQAVDPNTGSIMTATLTIPVTHEEMVFDELRPKSSQVVTVTPLWQVTVTKEAWGY